MTTRFDEIEKSRNTRTLFTAAIYTVPVHAVCTQEVPTFETLLIQGRVVFCIFE